jgi:hydrogenase expression/formation protein HypE
MPSLPPGKLPAELLERFFDKYVPASPRVVVGPRVGEDAAVLDMGDRYLVATTDPITFASEEIGWYAVHVNANDLAVRGARPLWFLATLLLPEAGQSEERVERLFAALHEACAELEIALVGGHTEVTAGVSRPIVVGCMLGEVDKGGLVTTGGARPGDVLLLTKGVPLEGAAILARDHGAEAARRGVSADVIDRARDFLRRPGISVLPEARHAGGAARLHAMHDPTEGGLATACWELAQAARVGVHVNREQIPILPEGRILCERFGLDPLGTIASGSLLMAVDSADAESVVGACRTAGIACAPIGKVTASSHGVTLASAGIARPMPSFPQDELSKVASSARG